MLFYAHAGLMAMGFIVMAVGVLIARYLKEKRWWLKSHRALETSATAILIGAFPTGILMVSMSGGPHFNKIHACAWTAVLILSLATATMGFLQLRMKGMAARLRPIHRVMGRITALLLLLNIVLGLSLAGIW